MKITLTKMPEIADLDRQRGINGYRNTSFTPEKRADSDRTAYVEAVLDFAEELDAVAVTEAQQAEAAAQVERYRLKYLEWTNTLWAAKGRTASPMITGPARFPVARNNKALDAEMNKIKAFLDWLPKAKRAALKAVQQAGQPAEEKAAAKPNEIVNVGDVSIVTNYEIERIQLFFPGKPDVETLGKLKGAGWNWSPKNQAWQRMITPATMRSAQQIAGAA